MPIPRIIVTSGEPAGIGPDLCIELCQRAWGCQLVVAGDPELFGQRARALGQSIEIERFDLRQAPCEHMPGQMLVWPHPVAKPVVAGQLDAANARYVLAMLDSAIDSCVRGDSTAVVTAPVQKSIINDAGVPFSGHTEYLAERTGGRKPVMLLAAGTLRVALATTHLPLSQIPAAITAPLLEEVITILDHDLRTRFGLAEPRIMVCGLNPHAGESGHLGREEIEVITPTLERLRSRGLRLQGPVPADTAFTPRQLAQADAVLAMYHDQGLPVLKHAGFGNAVNVTLGLPIVRTSVDHGTALELAGTGLADAGSLVCAVELALELS
jgi:4-hydroxythreonine-4-phosphate dehydrogenase